MGHLLASPDVPLAARHEFPLIEQVYTGVGVLHTE